MKESLKSANQKSKKSKTFIYLISQDLYQSIFSLIGESFTTYLAPNHVLGVICGYVLGVIVGFLLASPWLSSHWWKYNTTPIIVISACTICGQIILALTFGIKVAKKKEIVIKILFFSVLGIILSCLAFCWLKTIAMLLFKVDSFGLSPYIYLNILIIIMLGIFFGPLLGELIIVYKDKTRYR